MTGAKKKRWGLWLRACSGVLLSLGLLAVGPATAHAAAPAQSAASGSKIVSLAPNLTELVYALQVAEERLVGVSEQCDFPAAAKLKPKVGSYSAPNVELILKSGAKVVLATEGNPKPVLERLTRAGLQVVETHPQKASELPETVLTLGKALGAEDRAKALAAELSAALAGLKAKRPGQGKSFVLALQFDPVYSVNNDTWLGDLFVHAGFRNLVGTSALKYPVVAQEFLVANRPDVVFVAQPSPEDGSSKQTAESARARTLAQEKLYQTQLTALWGTRAPGPQLVLLPPDILVRPGPRLLEGIRFLENLALKK